MISVIVPFKNGEHFARRFSEGINTQSINKKYFELILISNRCEDNTENILKEVLAHDVKYRIEKFDDKPSSYAARNHGVNFANGDVYVFTDIDCKLDSCFLQNINDIFNTTEESAISGKVILEIIDKSNYWEVYDATSNLDNEQMAKNNHLVTANFAIRKELFYKVGYFDEYVSNGDSMYGERIINTGNIFFYHPNIKVLHPTRKNYYEIKKKLLRMAYGQGQTYRKKQKGLVWGFFIYTLKAFNIFNLIRIWKQMKKYITLGIFLKFSILFTNIRIQQIKAFVSGYKEDKLNIYNK